MKDPPLIANDMGDHNSAGTTPQRKRLVSEPDDSADSPPSSNKMARKFRTPQACDRCHRRKQKCDGNARCGPCVQAGVECTTTDKTSMRTITRSHLPELEEWLESLIDTSAPQLGIRTLPTNSSVAISIPSTSARSTYLTDPPPDRRPPSATKDVSDVTRLVFPEEFEPKGNLFLDPSLESGDSYIPPTAPSTYGLYGRNQAYDEDQQISSPTKVFVATIRSSSQPCGTEDTSGHTYPPFDVAKQYCEAYFHHNHIQSPFLHHASFQQRFVAFYSADLIDQHPHWIFIFNMVLAIGQTTLMRQEALRGEHKHAGNPDQFFDKAMTVIEHCLNRTSITGIQCLLLLTLYGLQHPQAVSIYRIVAQAMRVCIELSLHRTQNRKVTLTPLDREMRKRIFWSCYSLDRFASIALGRPCSIADECITCELPLDIDDAGIQQNSLVALPPGSISEMMFSLSIFKLRRITGRIIQVLYCSNQSRTNQATMVDRFVMELEAWRLTIPSTDQEASDQSIVPSVFKSGAWYNLGYWHARMLLYRLLAPKGSPHDLRNCAEAAIQSVRLYSVLLDEKRININWSTLALCFTAAVTLLWCIWLAPDRSLEPSIPLELVQAAIRDTERVLSALGEIWPQAQRTRDIYMDLCRNVVITESSGAIQGVANNIMDHLESSGQLSDLNLPYNTLDSGFLSQAGTGDPSEAFEVLGWTLGGFQV